MKLPTTPPDTRALLQQLADDPERFVRVMTTSVATPSGYPHWDKLRHKQAPEGLTTQEWWLRIKTARLQNERLLPSLRDREGKPFWFVMPDEVLELNDEITRASSGQIVVSDLVTNDETRARYVISSLMEEAITSSQLEGAVTTRVEAKLMLRSGREPRNTSERMIVNNYRAMQYISAHRGDPLTPEMVKRIHEIVTDATLDDPDAAGELQAPDETRVAIVDVRDGQVVHQPPDASTLSERLARLCEFANGADQGKYLPPVLRAIAVHFMVGYDHYFADGNGRTARALFYWSMLHEGFWLAEFLTVSTILRQAPAQYSRSFQLTETDGGDLTYFFLHHLRVIRRAIQELAVHLERKMGEMKAMQHRLREQPGEFNHRQIALLDHALRNPGFAYSAASHASSHGVTEQTARNDLSSLEARGYLRRGKQGRQFTWTAATGLSRLLGPAR